MQCIEKTKADGGLKPCEGGCLNKTRLNWPAHIRTTLSDVYKVSELPQAAFLWENNFTKKPVIYNCDKSML